MRDILIDHLQVVVGATAFGDMSRDRVALARRVQEALAEDLERMGLTVVSFRLDQIGEA